MTGMAAGMATCGLRPFTYTITPFATTRVMEQIRVDVCYHNLPVTIVGTGSGLSYASLGPTHHSLRRHGLAPRDAEHDGRLPRGRGRGPRRLVPRSWKSTAPSIFAWARKASRQSTTSRRRWSSAAESPSDRERRSPARAGQHGGSVAGCGRASGKPRAFRRWS